MATSKRVLAGAAGLLIVVGGAVGARGQELRASGGHAGCVAGAGCAMHPGVGGVGESVTEFGLVSAPATPWLVARADGASLFMRSVDAVAARTADPERVRRALLLGARASNLCYSPDLTPAEMERLVAATGLVPVTQITQWQTGRMPRFDLASTVWTGEGLQGPKGQATRARLTYSFAPDNATWGTDTRFFLFPNALNATLASSFAFQDAGREWIRQGLAAWKRVAGIEYDEVGDDGRAMDTVTTRRAGVGDVRIGGNSFLQTNLGSDLAGVLAYNNFPSNGSDMVLDLGEFTASNMLRPDNNFRFLRNVVAHEHGHGLGFIHQVPCDSTKLMEPLVSVAYDVLQIDDRRGAGSSYGDRFSGNVSAATAADLGTFNGLQEARFEFDMSTNGVGGPAGSGADWYKFTLDATRTMAIGVFPRGGTYSTGEQMSTPTDACAGSSASLDASRAGDVDVQLLDSTGTTVLASSANGAGVDESLSRTLGPGTYYVRVYDFGPNAADKVQLYDLLLGYNLVVWNPYANAGINKRINVNELCRFMGDVNSRQGGLPIDSYQWDLDGNGTLETVAPRPITVYSTPGIRRVRMVVVDSAGHNANDSITVTVIGGAPTLALVQPQFGGQGTTVPVTIPGTNLGSPTVSVLGGGVTVVGTPSVDLTSASSPITGLSFVIDPLATPGPRTVMVTTPSGTVQGGGTFIVTQAVATLGAISPASGVQGSAAPLTINGSSFNGPPVVTVDGTGVTLTGTPVVNAARTQITGLTIAVTANASPGPRTLRVSVNGSNPTTTFTVVQAVPGNDLCTAATPLTLGVAVSGQNVAAGIEGAVPTACASSTNSDVYYSFTPDCTGGYRLETAPNTFDTVLSVHTGCPATAANSVACNDDAGGVGLNSLVDATLTIGTAYTVRVASFGARATGAFTVSAAPTTPVVNDACAGALPLPVGPTTFNTCLALSEAGSPAGSCVITGKDVWYRYTAPQTARTTLSTCGSSFDTVLEVFAGACGAGPAVVCNDDLCGVQSTVSLRAAAGTSYAVRVSGFDDGAAPIASGTATLTRYCPADSNLSGTITVADIFDFLSRWFASSQAADFNGDGTLAVSDIFSFLSGWFGGC